LVERSKITRNPGNHKAGGLSLTHQNLVLHTGKLQGTHGLHEGISGGEHAQPGKRGEFRCRVCNHLLELFDGSREVALRLTVVPGRRVDNRFSK